MTALPVTAQVFTTTPQFSNTVKPNGSTNSASATLASGANYAPASRPTEANAGRFKVDSWTAGMPFSSAPPDFNIGDIITPPPQVDLNQAPTVVTTNGAFYMAARKQLVAAQSGACQVQWKMTDGSTKSITYTIGAVPSEGASRLFWTEDISVGGVNTNTTSIPDHGEFAVSLSEVYAKIHYNTVVPDFDPADSQGTPAGRSARSNKAEYSLDLPAIWIDDNDLLRARGQSGYIIIEYFDTASFDNSVGYEVVYVGPPRVYKTYLELGDRLLPSDGSSPVEELVASTSKAKDYVTQWTAQGSHFTDYIFATAVNSDVTQPDGDPSKAQVLWQKPGNLGIVWPYESHWYGIAWPGDQSSHLYVFDPANPAGSPPISVPTNYTATVVWSEKTDAILKADSSGSKISAVGEGRALIQYQNQQDVWFVPVRSVARTNGTYVSNQEYFWPVGRPVQPLANHPRIQFDGVGNYLTFPSDLAAGHTVELWVKPNSLTNHQSLVQFLDYPQQALVQVALSLTNANLRLTVLTSGTSTTTGITSTNSLAPGVWSHVAFVKRSNGSLQLLVNGVEDVSMTVSTYNASAVANGTYAQVIVAEGSVANGAAPSGLAYFSGEIREVRLWSKDQTAAAIKSNLSAQLSGGEQGLIHLLTPSWQQDQTPYERDDASTFDVLDLATGFMVPGYGTPSTTGQLPFALDRRLSFVGTNNWAEIPITWNQADNKAVEFWYFSGGRNGWQSLVAGTSGSTTNLLVGIQQNGRLALSTTGSGANLIQGSTVVIGGNSYHHIAVSSVAGFVTVYLDGVPQASATLPGTPTSVTANRLILLSSAPLSTFPVNSGVVEMSDLRVYGASRSSSQISSDMISSPNLADPDLIRSVTFDQIQPATVSGESVLQLPDAARGYLATYHGTASLGSSLSSATPAEVTGGIVRLGTAYHPGIYANESRIIPVNSTPTNSVLEVWWNDSFTAPYLAVPLRIPGTVSRYRLFDPLAPPTLAVAGQDSTGYPIPTSWDSPSVYYQNDVSAVGFNPNEEHALIIGSSLYATRWDLNQDATSHPYVLLQYKDLNRGSASFLQPVWVVPTNSVYPTFDRPLLVGQLLQAPKPLVDFPQSPLSGPLSGGDPLRRLYQDRQYHWWARSATNPADSVPSRWFYPLQDGFYWPSSLGVKHAGDPVPFGNTGNGLIINYSIQWPPVVPTLALGQTLSDAMPSANNNGTLPAVTGQKSVEILFDEANYTSKTAAVLMDPSSTSSATLQNLNGINTATDVRLGKTYFTLLPPHLRNRVYWDPVTYRLNLTGDIVRPVTGFPYVLPAWLGSTGNTNTDYSVLAGLSTAPTWQTAVQALRRNAIVITSAETPFDSLVLSPSGMAGGYVTLGMNTRQALNNTGDPVSLYPIFVDTTQLYTGVVLVMYSDNKFDQYVTLRHSGDFGGDPSQYQFEWRYSSPVNGQAPTTDPGTWISYSPATPGLNRVIFGGPGIQTLKDQYFSCRWRCTAAGAPNTNWSRWTSPAFVQSWLTRAMDGINPFEQRVESLANNHVDLKTSILSQAGKRFVGAIPLNMDNADNYGLIETYETLLQQARNLSIDSGYSDTDVNDSLLDSASKLNELYTILGDEALNDAKDPTVAWGSRDLNDVFFGSRASSLFAFQGIVPNLLEEELALLRGLDDTTSTPVTTYPVYNRLYWNFTKGISGGEPAYALNYGIPSVAGDVNGSITEADAAQLYPQGHGDAYGHYLSALKQYYRLLVNTNFTWYPRAEVKAIGGVNVTFDYVDERKMAATALQLARTAEEILHRTYRRDYKVDPAQHAPLYSDSNVTRAWSATEWADRGSQGILYNWMVLNSLLPGPSGGDTPQTVSRATVPELAQLAGMMSNLQNKQDDMDRGDSPMGMDANVVPFDVDPAQVDAGQSHFDQVFGRAATAMQSAHNILQRASLAAANLRRQNASLESFRYQVEQREAEFNTQLVDLYGSPYPDDVGATGTYVSGYNGPDLYHYNYVDRDLFSPEDAGAVTNVTFHAQYSVTGDSLDTLTALGTEISYTINSDGIPVLPSSWTLQRTSYGKIQGALGDYIRAFISVRAAVSHLNEHKQQLEARLQRLRDHNSFSDYYGAIGDQLSQKKSAVDLLIEGIDATMTALDTLDAEVQSAYEASKDPLPDSFIAGLAAGGDLSFPARIGLAITKLVGEESIGAAKDAATFASYAAGKVSSNLDDQIAANDSALADAEDQSQTVYESTFLLSQLNADKDSVFAAAVTFRQAWQTYVSLIAKGNQLQADLLAFRQANASRIQEARYADVIFRTFKNEDLEQYLQAYLQASRYVLAAAQVYDYETGLLDPSVVAGRDGDFTGEVIRAAQLGDMVAGQPVIGPTSEGSLASILARMRANWSVLKGRFGINNPTRETHKISLRQELFRIGRSTDPVTEAANVTAWQNRLYSYRVADIRQVPEFKNYAQRYSPMATNEPALVITFPTEITAGRNFFGLPLAGGDTVLDSAHFTTKLRGAAVGLEGFNAALGNTLTRSPRVYLFPAGVDRQRTPLSNGSTIRDWRVVDQSWPIPYASAAGNVNLQLEAIGTDNVHSIRRFSPMRAYDSTELASLSAAAYDARLIGRSAWNTEWVLIIPGSALSGSPSSALDSLINSITDIQLVLQTYSYSGN